MTMHNDLHGSCGGSWADKSDYSHVVACIFEHVFCSDRFGGMRLIRRCP